MNFSIRGWEANDVFFPLFGRSTLQLLTGLTITGTKKKPNVIVVDVKQLPFVGLDGCVWTRQAGEDECSHCGWQMGWSDVKAYEFSWVPTRCFLPLLVFGFPSSFSYSSSCKAKAKAKAIKQPIKPPSFVIFYCYFRMV